MTPEESKKLLEDWHTAQSILLPDFNLSIKKGAIYKLLEAQKIVAQEEERHRIEIEVEKLFADHTSCPCPDVIREILATLNL